MLRGDLVGLRARHEADIAILESELYGDVREHARADGRAWQPIPPGNAASPYAIKDPDDRFAPFSVVELSSGELAGESALWNIDRHNRSAHVGLALRPGFRGRGLGSDAVAVLCEYGFAVLGLHRLQIETLVDNHAMISTAGRNGFQHDGTLRQSAWVYGEFMDQLVYGLLHTDWLETRRS